MVNALPEIVSSHPEVLYFVVGATHPHSKAENGEDYRLGLHLRAKELCVAGNIVFHDRFLELDELLEIIRAADIYVTPYLNEAQIVSGTLAYALGARQIGSLQGSQGVSARDQRSSGPSGAASRDAAHGL